MLKSHTKIHANEPIEAAVHKAAPMFSKVKIAVFVNAVWRAFKSINRLNIFFVAVDLDLL